MKYTYINKTNEGAGALTFIHTYEDGILTYGCAKCLPCDSDEYDKTYGKMIALEDYIIHEWDITIPGEQTFENIKVQMLVDAYNRYESDWVKDLLEEVIEKMGYCLFDYNEEKFGDFPFYTIS